MSEQLQAIIAAIGAAVILTIVTFSTGLKGVVLAWFKRWEDRIAKSSTKKAYINGIRRLAEFHGVLEQIRELEYVDRVLVFVGRNCGGTPQPGKPYTVECLHGWSQREGSHPEKLYNYNVPVDAYYMEMLLKALKEGWVINKTDDMPKNALLTMFYREEGVYEGLLFPVHLTDVEFIFISVASYKRSFTESETAKLTLYLARMRSIFTTTVEEPT